MKVLENVSLKEYNTFGLEARGRRLVVVERDDEAPLLAAEKPLLLLGGGSNMLFANDYQGTVGMLARRSEAEVLADGRVRAWGGMVMDDLVAWCIERGLYGLENLSAIPGTVGASAVQNVGAYGVEAKDVIESVEVYDFQERCHSTLSNADCCFAYRHSLFKQCPGRYLVLRVVFRLHKEFVPNLSYKTLEGLPHASAEELRQAIADLRWSKLPRPEEHGSAGSFFKNPVVDKSLYQQIAERYPDMPPAHAAEGGYKLSAGWLIDQAGWKGRTQGGAGVWPRNALVLYNTGGCTGDEVEALAKAIQEDVKQKFGVVLDPEAIII